MLPMRCVRWPCVCIESSDSRTKTWPRDFYAILGVPRNATEEQIRQRFRELARSATPTASRAKQAARRGRVPGDHPGVQHARRPDAAAPARHRAVAPAGASPRRSAAGRQGLPAARRQGVQGEELLRGGRQLRPRHPRGRRQRPGLAPPGAGLQPEPALARPRGGRHRAGLRARADERRLPQAGGADPGAGGPARAAPSTTTARRSSGATTTRRSGGPWRSWPAARAAACSAG